MPTNSFLHECLGQGRPIWKASTILFQTRWERENLQGSLGENLACRRDQRVNWGARANQTLWPLQSFCLYSECDERYVKDLSWERGDLVYALMSTLLHLENRLEGSRAETRRPVRRLCHPGKRCWWSGPTGHSETAKRKNTVERGVGGKGRRETQRWGKKEQDTERQRQKHGTRDSEVNFGQWRRETQMQRCQNTDILSPMTPNTFPTPTHAWRLDKKRSWATSSPSAGILRP